MDNISYRRLGPGDAVAYSEIRLQCLKIYPENFGTTYEELAQSPFKLEECIINANSGNFIIGAFTAKNELAGICGFIRETRLKTMHRGELVQLFVYPHFAKQGIGENLVNLIIQQAFAIAGVEQIILGVVESNIAAVRLYERLGFVKYGKLEGYFRSVEKHYTQLFFVRIK